MKMQSSKQFCCVKFLLTTYSTTHKSEMVHLLLLGNKTVDDGVEENSSNSDRASDQLQRVEGLSHDKGDTDDNNDTLGSVGDRLSDGTGLLESHGGELVVSVEPESGGNQVDPESRGGLSQLSELAEAGSLLDKHDWDGHEECKDGGKCELVSNGSHTVLESFGIHELLVLVTLEGSEQVGNARSDKGGDSKVKLLDGSKDDTTNDDWETEPLGGGDLLLVDELSNDSGESWLGGFDDLCEGDGTSTHGKDGSTVSTHEAESNRKHLDDIILGDGWLGTGIWCEPHEDSVDHTNTKLKGGDGHWESNLSSGSLQGQLVGDVVVVISDIPEEEVE